MKFVSVILVLISCLSSDSNFLFHGEPSNPVLGDNYGKETVYKITLDFIVYLYRKYVKYGGVPYHLNYIDLKYLNTGL